MSLKTTATVKTGLEVLLETASDKKNKARTGLLSNQASISKDYRHIADLVQSHSSFKLEILFAPEHGFRGELQDMDCIEDSIDAYTSLPIRSLYGDSKETLCPSEEDLKNLDILIVDLPDIGARYYTFAQTMMYSMEVAAKTGTKVIVLDRPNPINGTSIEGARLEASCRSFCGYQDTPNRHGLTLGELALMANKGFGEGDRHIPGANCELEILKVEGWSRSEYLDQTDLPWIYPSPNMPTLETAVIYPGSCIFEATEISEARGTTRPLEQFGAPYIDGRHWAEKCLKEKITLEGAILRPMSFVPKFQKHAGSVCYGVQLHVTDREKFQPMRWSLALIASAYRLYPKEFKWRGEAFEFEDKILAIDLLYGSDAFRKALEADKSLSEIESAMTENEKAFREVREPFLLY